MRDWSTRMATVSAINPAIYNDDAPVIAVDRSGFDSVTFVASIGIGGIAFTPTNRIDLIMEHSDDGTTWDPVGATNVLNGAVDANGVVLSQRAVHAAATVHRFGYVDGIIGDRRYVRLRADFNGTHGTGTPLSAIAILGEARELPVAA